MQSLWYSYGRVTLLPGRSIIKQRRKNWHRYKLARLHEGLPELEYGKFHCDHWDLVSSPFLDRPIAQAMWLNLRAGDCLIASGFDLCFKNAADLREVAKKCQLADITLIVTGQRYNTSRMNEQSLRQRFHRMKKTISLRGIRRREYHLIRKHDAARASR